ncbi:hypothetical protein BABINDRAFT_132806 [Babjeviella inositovora NRRL Y-12698]|uniref:RRM domain-containing protein n=1 Tax=Babjeviella inositovora NRRL Y-12698 TaxID=984486 RepID=A0A1E3QRR5_9ASCO|nr:uncharacterized protein BABINDRAFT_132806 [Babjeviella inositovora NRRL Y-12698]ODQ80371.1 hypothetical protein BABINDRAFT_132806 [Babjeviella inositovora NRRL Y-12698]
MATTKNNTKKTEKPKAAPKVNTEKAKVAKPKGKGKSKTKTDVTNDTLYVRNLNERISINKLKTTLTEKFGEYGAVIQVEAYNNLKMKGQAFVTFSSVEAATKAKAALNDFELFEKKMEIQFARSKSDAWYKHKAEETGDLTHEEMVEKRKREKKEKKQREKELEAKKQLGQISSIESFSKKQATEDSDANPPHTTIIIHDLPASVTNANKDKKLVALFEKAFSSFVEVRLVAIKKLAFVVFEDLEDSIKAKKDLNAGSTKIDGGKVKATFAKK